MDYCHSTYYRMLLKPQMFCSLTALSGSAARGNLGERRERRGHAQLEGLLTRTRRAELLPPPRRRVICNILERSLGAEGPGRGETEGSGQHGLASSADSDTRGA